MRCEGCKFWEYTQLGGDEQKLGMCRRYAPRGKLIDSTDYFYEWSITEEHDWCGEFKPKPNEETEVEKTKRRAISELNLSVRARNVLGKMGINTIYELIATTDNKLLSQKNCGTTCLREVRLLTAEWIKTEIENSKS